jgi:hypothetical protein
MRFIAVFLLTAMLLSTNGCGYTTTSLLPPELDSIHVANFVNKIDPTREISNRRSTYFYSPGLENDITRAVIDGFIFDRHLDIKNKREAMLLMKGQLVDLEQYPLSYNKNEDVVEYRIEIYVNIQLYDNRSDKLMWEEKRFMGWSSYDVTGQNAMTESEGIKKAVKDLAQRVVERTVEAW